MTNAPPPEEAALRAAYVLARQRAAGPEYAVHVAGSGLRADNAVQGFVATFARTGFVLRERVAADETPGWEASIAIDAFGCPNSLAPLEQNEPRADGVPNRIEQAHGELDAWYLNGPLGLEQGFDVPKPPACLAAEGQLTIAMTVAGLTPRLGARREVQLVDAEGNVALRYEGLHVVDAEGATVPAALRVANGSLLIDVDAATAIFPLAIDPLWAEQVKLVASDSSASDTFGSSVSVFGDTALVGSPFDLEAGSAAYVFVRSGMSWSEQAKLTPSDGGVGSSFGAAVSLWGDTALVGAWHDGGVAPNAGAAYVFVRNGTSWTQQAKLTASDAAAQDGFGYSVSLSGETALVGAIFDDGPASNSGAAYVFVRSGTSWTQQAKLTANDGALDDNFGNSLSLSGETALVGAFDDDAAASSSGSAYVFVRSGTSWTQQAKLVASDGAPYDYFGYSVSLSGDRALIGAGASDEADINSGSAYVFVRSGTSWTEQTKLTASDGEAQDVFGQSVSLSGDRALIGAQNHGDAGVGAGSAYLFLWTGAGWVEQPELFASDAGAGDNFGYSVSLSGDTALVGAWFDDDAGSNSGSAYVFVREVDVCTLDSECVSGFCRDGACCENDCGGGDPNDCQACSIAAGSSSAFDGICALTVAGNECDDGSACTQADACQGGVCGGSPVVCDPLDSCHDAGACDPTDGACSDPIKPNGSPCDSGTCQDGSCEPDGSGGSGGSSAPVGVGGAAANGGAAATAGGGGQGGAGASVAEDGCSCGVVVSADGTNAWLGLVGLGVLATRGRRRRFPVGHRVWR